MRSADNGNTGLVTHTYFHCFHSVLPYACVRSLTRPLTPRVTAQEERRPRSRPQSPGCTWSQLALVPMDTLTREITMGVKRWTRPVLRAPGVRPWNKSFQILHAGDSGCLGNADAIAPPPAIAPTGRLTAPATEQGSHDPLREKTAPRNTEFPNISDHAPRLWATTVPLNAVGKHFIQKQLR